MSIAHTWFTRLPSSPVTEQTGPNGYGGVAGVRDTGRDAGRIAHHKYMLGMTSGAPGSGGRMSANSRRRAAHGQGQGVLDEVYDAQPCWFAR
jgi:hypothetical protein